jgi:hypothetical protein
METNFFEIRNDEMMRRAIERARERRPVVRCLDAGKRLFSVESKTDVKKNLVEFKVTDSKKKLARCVDHTGEPCRGLNPRARCYHVAAAAAANIYVQTIRRQLEGAAA